jgi:hypothetical protein
LLIILKPAAFVSCPPTTYTSAQDDLFLFSSQNLAFAVCGAAEASQTPHIPPVALV